MFRDLERAGEPYVDLGASRMIAAALGRDGSTAPGSAVLVSGGYFAALGVGPELGRVLGEQDVGEGPAATVVLSYDYWQTAYAADPAVLGKTLVVAGHPLTIVGVAPRGFVGTTPGERPDVFAPLTLEWFRGAPADAARRGPVLQLRLRVRALEARRLARASASGAGRDVSARSSTTSKRRCVASRAAPDVDIEEFRAREPVARVRRARAKPRAPTGAAAPLAVFFAATATILLIGCVNLANLMFARGAARVGEIAVRASLGAARRRLVALLSVEALLLAGFAARRELARSRSACCERSTRCSRRA